MNTTIIIFVVVLIAIVAAAYYFTGGFHKKTTNSTVNTTTSTTSATTSLNATATSTSTSTSTSIMFSSCLSKNATEPIKNGNFSTGTYEGWNAIGPGFGNAPFNITAANSNTNPNYTGYYGVPWNGYNGSYVSTSFNRGGGLALQSGNLTSDLFQVSELYLNFKLISSKNDQLYLEILSGGKPAIITHYDTYAAQNVSEPQSTFVNASMPIGTLLCDNVTIKIVAGVTGLSSEGKGYIAAGDFYMSRTPRSTPGIVTNQTIFT